jgi:hypothetical protein
MGVVRRFLHEYGQRLTEYPAPWAMNVRLEDGLTNRLRGGSFTGISAGSRPSEIRYRDRVLTFSSNAITATRQGADTDTTLSADVSDAQRPALFQFSYGGATGGTMVALIPHKDRYLLGFTADETWVHQGNLHTGTRQRASDEVGIIGADAWCLVDDVAYFMSSSGLYSIGVDGSGLKALSENKVPEDLTGLSDTACTLTYNHADRGVYIHLTNDPDWFYDAERDQFWPFDTDTTDSHLLIGPLRLGGPDSYGMVQQIHGIMAASSATVAWRIVPGDTAEEAADNGKSAITAAVAGNDYDEYVSSSGAWDAGRSPVGWPRATSMWCCLWLSSTGTWAFESVHLTVTPFGRYRG